VTADGLDADGHVFTTGQLYLRNSNNATDYINCDTNELKIRFENSTPAYESIIRAQKDAQVELYHNGSSKLATTSTGIDVTGKLTASTGVDTTGKITISNATGSLPATSGTTQVPTVLSLSGVGNQVLNVGNYSVNNAMWFQNNNPGALSINYPILFQPNGGNVGIGTENPASVFHAKGTSATPNNLINVINVESATTGTAANGVGTKMTFWGSMTGQGNVELGQIGFHNNNVSGAHGEFVVLTRPNGTSAERLRITSAGNVGIGTASPSTKLDVAGEIKLSTTGLSAPAAGAGAIRYTTGKLEVSDGTGWSLVSKEDFSATGGTITTYGSYKVHTFLSSGSFSVNGSTGSVDVLIVAGGGGAGSNAGGDGGGGGAGGVIVTSLTLAVGTYPVTIGSGGSGSSTASNGGNGNNSVFSGNTAIGGGGGSTGTYHASSGGSGGGAGSNGSSQGNPGSGTSGQGFSGGSDYSSEGSGGGGWQQAGNGNGTGGNGNVNSYRTGSNIYYAGGGGGGRDAYNTSGGQGGGGDGRTLSGNTPGTANTGGGGGGSGGSSHGQPGGSGIIVIRYST
jgi:hypothetical protein